MYITVALGMCLYGNDVMCMVMYGNVCNSYWHTICMGLYVCECVYMWGYEFQCVEFQGNVIECLHIDRALDSMI